MMAIGQMRRNVSFQAAPTVYVLDQQWKPNSEQKRVLER